MRYAGCGVDVPGGTEGCRALFDEILARDFSNYAYGRSHRLMVDAYAVQHPDAFCVSAKSFAAHLGGLCCALENGADPETYRALQRWLNGRSPVEKPTVPSLRGVVTIVETYAAADPAAYADAVKRWARSAWEAYGSLHQVARDYLRAATGAPGRSRAEGAGPSSREGAATRGGGAGESTA